MVLNPTQTGQETLDWLILQTPPPTPPPHPPPHPPPPTHPHPPPPPTPHPPPPTPVTRDTAEELNPLNDSLGKVFALRNVPNAIIGGDSMLQIFPGQKISQNAMTPALKLSRKNLPA